MKIFGVPEWMCWYLSVRAKFAGLSESDYYLHGAGRALGFVRTAACALDESYSRQEVGEYHAYTGLSAARTSIDFTASWLEKMLEFQMDQRHQVNTSRKEFRKEVSQVRPEVSKYVKNLGTLGKQIDKHRQRAQHREGLAISPHMDSEESGHPGGWYLAISADQTADLHLSNLLNRWADAIEENLREMLRTVAPGEMQEAEKLLDWQSKLDSST